MAFVFLSTTDIVRIGEGDEKPRFTAVELKFRNEENGFWSTGTLAPPDEEAWDHNERSSGGWMRAFEKLGIPWPKKGNGQPLHWTSVHSLLAKHGILEARDFR